MLSKGGWTCLSCIWAVLPAASAVGAAAPEKLFQELFGAEAKKVAATPAKTDDVELAQKLLKSSNTLTEAPALRVYLSEKAYEFGMAAPQGYGTAQAALNLLDTSAPERKEQWDEKRLELYKALYRTGKSADKKTAGENYVTQCLVVGDNKANAGLWAEAVALYQQAVSTATFIRSLQKAEAAERLATANQMKDIEQLKEQLKKDPENAAVRMALIRTYVELDQPGWAVPYVNHPNVGEAWRTYVPLAAKGIDALPTQVCLELGNWYKTLAAGALADARSALAKRARSYYITYLRKARAGGATANALADAREKINAALVQVGQAKLPDQVASYSPAAEQALKKAVEYLWSQQAGDGSWPCRSSSYSAYSKGYYSTRSTAAALLALFRAGAGMSDKRVANALNFLGTTNTPITDGVAMRALVWNEAQLRRSGIFYKGLKSDVGALLIATNDGGHYTRVYTSSYSYPSDNAHSWTPPIAVQAGDKARLKVPRKYWQLVLSYWAKQQKADGGWASNSSSSSSYGTPNCLWAAIGTATVATALENLYGPEAVKRMSGANYAALKNGLGYLDKNLRSIASLKGRYSSSSSYSSYYGSYGTVYDGLWCLSRLGMATSRKDIGSVDWCRAGSEFLVSTQQPNGSWGGDVETARAILFLVNCARAEKAGVAGAAKITPVALKPVAAEDPLQKIALKKIGLMKERLAQNPSSTTIPKELVRLYVVELQTPGPAMAYAARTGDKETPQLVGLASKDVGSLAEQECLKLAKWYTELAGGSSIAGQRHACTRAEACYERFLEKHTRRDADYLRAKLGLQGVQAQLAGLKKD